MTWGQKHVSTWQYERSMYLASGSQDFTRLIMFCHSTFTLQQTLTSSRTSTSEKLSLTILDKVKITQVKSCVRFCLCYFELFCCFLGKVGDSRDNPRPNYVWQYPLCNVCRPEPGGWRRHLSCPLQNWAMDDCETLAAVSTHSTTGQ